MWHTGGSLHLCGWPKNISHLPPTLSLTSPWCIRTLEIFWVYQDQTWTTSPAYHPLTSLRFQGTGWLSPPCGHCHCLTGAGSGESAYAEVAPALVCHPAPRSHFPHKGRPPSWCNHHCPPQSRLTPLLLEKKRQPVNKCLQRLDPFSSDCWHMLSLSTLTSPALNQLWEQWLADIFPKHSWPLIPHSKSNH